jgi:hypothetical protein
MIIVKKSLMEIKRPHNIFINMEIIISTLLLSGALSLLYFSLKGKKEKGCGCNSCTCHTKIQP